MPDADVVLYGDLAESIRDEFAFDTQNRRELLRQLRSGDHARLEVFVDELLANSIMALRMGARGPYALLEMLLHAIRDTDGMDPHLAQSINFNELAALPSDEERIRFCRATFARIADAVSGRKGARGDVIMEIVDFVDLNYHDPAMCLTFLSDRFNLSPIYISRLFKQKTGGNFLDYLNRKRVERAKQLLSDRRALIKRVGGAAGFSSDVSFRRVFHKYVAMSPGEFRREALRAASRPASAR
jgi:AraC-like DNA-binding protein